MTVHVQQFCKIELNLPGPTKVLQCQANLPRFLCLTFCLLPWLPPVPLAQLFLRFFLPSAGPWLLPDPFPAAHERQLRLYLINIKDGMP